MWKRIGADALERGVSLASIGLGRRNQNNDLRKERRFFEGKDEG